MNLRHFRALSKKNWINWKRTFIGSIIELLCPFILLGVLGAFRLAIPFKNVDNVDLHKLKHGLYPMSQYDPVARNYTMSSDYPYTRQDRLLNKFMSKANVTTDENREEYYAMLDGRGAMNFFPPHCVSMPQFDVFGSPGIAYVKSKSRVQRKLVRQLKLFYSNQKDIWQLIRDNQELMKYLKEMIEKARKSKLT
jgi:hypothetical protein